MKSAYERSLNILLHSSKSEFSLRKRLAELGHDESDINEGIEKLKELGYINDENYLRTFIEDSALSRRGRRRIIRDMQNAGYERETIEEQLEVLLPEHIEYENAMVELDKILQKLPATLPEEKKEFLKLKDKTYRKVVSKLNTLGYENDLIYNVASKVADYFQSYS